MRAFFACLLALTSLATKAATTDHVTEGSRAFHAVLLTCPERIWPGMDWSKTQFLYTSAKTKEAFLISASSRQAESVPVYEIPETAFRSGYSFFQYRGLQTVSISLDDAFFNGRFTPFTLSVHEMFHREGQKGWKTGGGAGGTFVPVDPRPRYLRGEIFTELTSAFSDPSHLQKAADWYKEWSTGFSHEVASSTDGYEGTADYVELLASVFAEKGCGISTSELYSEIAVRIGEKDFAPGITLDQEGYVMGSVAGLLLDRQGVDWKAQAALGITPLALLLDGKSTGVPVENATKAREYSEAFAEVNAQIDTWRIPYEARLADPATVRVAVPRDWVKGSYSPKGFYIPAVKPNLIYEPFNGEHRFRAPSAHEWITAAGDSIAYSDSAAEICSGTLWYLIVDRKYIIESDGAFKVEAGETTFNVGGTYKTDGEGFSYLCSAGISLNF